jgi:serine/threonine protein kinase
MAVDPARAKALFLEASDLGSPEERAAYLDRECGGDAALRARVEVLLAAHDGDGAIREPDTTGVSQPELARTQEMSRASVLRNAALPELASTELRSDGDAATIGGPPRAKCPGGFGPGRVVAGRYTLLDLLGEGGMGAVYRAEQSQPVKRQVALKLIKTGMDSRAVLARFDAERQALALMEHPNIARVYDGGATEANQPFFVMELVSGVPITDYCDQQRLPVPARLELFVAVCQAVQHAHQKGIIHRDLKPSNILVTEVDGRPTPKVIDFGVAKATEFNLTDQSFADTGAIVGTPAYMSPEQADPASMDIDTRTDVYALGVILYELLSGSPPIDAKQFKRGAVFEMLRMVREVDPPRPSTKVSTADGLPIIAASRGLDPGHLKRALQGDLDWIVMKALEKDRTRRYETANGFAADIRRHLAHEPVVAAPPSRVYRLRKFVRKHKAGAIAASLVLLTLLAGIAGTTWGLFEARRQELEARRQERIARSETSEKEKARRAEAMRAEGERLAKQKALAAALAEKNAKETAEAAQEAGRKLLYTTDMRLAPFLWRDDRTTADQLRVLLAKHIPEERMKDEGGGMNESGSSLIPHPSSLIPHPSRGPISVASSGATTSTCSNRAPWFSRGTARPWPMRPSRRKGRW